MSTTAKKKVNLLLIGLSKRGKALLDLLLEMDDVNVAAVCDVYEDRLQNAVQAVEKVYGKKPAASTDYRALLDVPGLDAVFTPSSWTSHVQVCLDAMNAGLYAATEVGGATSVQQCWDLVRTSEKTGKPCMLMENCCYGREELTILNMVKLGLFGELVHAEGGYRHDLRREICMGHVDRHYRLDNYLHRNGDVYPTHDVGPIAKYLDINRGNRMLSLVSVASKSVGNEAWVKSHLQQYPQLEEINDRETVVRKVTILPLEVIIRNISAGHFAQRYGVEEGIVFDEPTIEFSYKNDDLHDPLLNAYHAIALKLATREEIELVKSLAFRVNDVLKAYFKGIGVTLVDFKLEFGKTADGRIVLADEISPDTCRFWDAKTGEKLDKDRFRRDMGGVEDAYNEMKRRVLG